MKSFKIKGKEDASITDVQLDELSADKIRVAIRSVGICGSDLHYYFSGACGDFVIKAPFVCGHEASGVIHEVGSNYSQKYVVNTPVAINPSHSCGKCYACYSGNTHQCESLSFLGSASTWPHTDGFMQSYIDVYPEQCIPLASDISFQEGACSEPLSVAIHAVEKVATLVNKNVCIMGAGPIGLLIAKVAKFYGAQTITFVDIEDNPLRLAKQMDADNIVNVFQNNDELEKLSTQYNGFDVFFEATGSPISLENAIRNVKSSGTIVQVGTLPAEVNSKSMRLIMNKEITYIGSMRFTNKNFCDAVHLINTKAIDVSGILSPSHSVDDIKKAFHVAKDKTVSCKVQVLF